MLLKLCTKITLICDDADGLEGLVAMLEDVDNIDHGERGRLELRLELVGVLKGLEDLEGSVEFLSPEARRVMNQAFLEVRRRASVRYVV